MTEYGQKMQGISNPSSEKNSWQSDGLGAAVTSCIIRFIHNPQGQTINAAYYCTNILDTTCKDAVSRKRKLDNSADGYDFKHVKNYFYAGRSHCPHSQSAQRSSHPSGRKLSGQGTLRI